MLAIVFPGQGSQSVGMMDALGAAYPEVREAFDEASDAVSVDLWRLASEGPEDQLNATENTQPALLAAGVATWRVWLAQGGASPAFLAGHSLGEYSALVAAGSLSLSDAARVVAERGRLMQGAVPAGQGAMAAVLGLDDEALAAVCQDAAQDQVVAPVNFNSPGQVVIAGDAAAVARASEAATSAGAKRVVPLPVSVPSHCALMRPAAEALGDVLSDVQIEPPQIPVVHNADVALHSEPAEIRQALVSQLYSPVRWSETMSWMVRQGVTHVVECGPGKVLAGLMRRIDRSVSARPVVDPASLEAAIADLATTED